MLYARCALLALLAVHADAFQLGGLAPRAAASAVRAHALCAADAAELPCAQPDAPGGVLMNDVLITGTTLRSMTLADASGARVRSGSLLGDEGRAVVVFLRHLG